MIHFLNDIQISANYLIIENMTIFIVSNERLILNLCNEDFTIKYAFSLKEKAQSHNSASTVNIMLMFHAPLRIEILTYVPNWIPWWSFGRNVKGNSVFM